MNTKNLQEESVKIQSEKDSVSDLPDSEFVDAVFDMIKLANGGFAKDRPKNKFDAIEELRILLEV